MKEVSRRDLLRALCGAAILTIPAVELAKPADDAALIALARRSVACEVLRSADDPVPVTESPARGVFVTIERGGRVVGCRGTLLPRCRTCELEVIAAARAAAGHDPRYRPLTPADLKDFLVTVTLIDHLQPMSEADVSTLAAEEGLVLKSGTRTGVVLPWEGRDPVVRLRWAYQKAGVAPGAGCSLQRMIARRFRG